MTPAIEELQRQIAALQNLTTNFRQPQQVQPVKPVQPTVLTIADVEKIVESKLQNLSREPNLLKIIGKHLTEGEQLWLSRPDVLLLLPEFVGSAAGKDLIQLFVTEFKAYESKTRGDNV